MTVDALPLQGDPSSRKVRGGDKEVGKIQLSYNVRVRIISYEVVAPLTQGNGARVPPSKSFLAAEVLRHSGL